MSLRIRLLLVVATTFAVVVVGCVYAAHVITRQELRSETDRFLEQRSPRSRHHRRVREPRRAIPGQSATGRRRDRERAARERSGVGATGRDRAVARREREGRPLDRQSTRDTRRCARQGDRRARWARSLPHRLRRGNRLPRPDDRAAARRRRADRAQHHRHEQRAVEPRPPLVADRAGGHGGCGRARVVDRAPHRAAHRAAHAGHRTGRADAGARASHRGRPPRRDRAAGHELQHHARRAGVVARAATASRYGREPRAANTADRAADEHRTAAARRFTRRSAADRAGRRRAGRTLGAR